MPTRGSKLTEPDSRLSRQTRRTAYHALCPLRAGVLDALDVTRGLARLQSMENNERDTTRVCPLDFVTVC